MNSFHKGHPPQHPLSSSDFLLTHCSTQAGSSEDTFQHSHRSISDGWFSLYKFTWKILSKKCEETN